MAHSGWGEGHAPLGPRATRAVVEDVLAPLLIGKDALAIERHWERMYGSMRLRGHVAGYQLEAMSAVDIALWDVAGKLLDAPVYTLLGGPFRTELPAYVGRALNRDVRTLRLPTVVALPTLGLRPVDVITVAADGSASVGHSATCQNDTPDAIRWQCQFTGRCR
jgi:L-alanine-DL-glutamate epimerase-like enolase superfamily enzyme